MSVTAADYQNLIVTSLSQNDPTVLEVLQARVPLIWRLHARTGYQPELQYWYTRRDTIRQLMALTRTQIDNTRVVRDASRTGSETATATAASLSTASQDGKQLTDRTGSANYDDLTTSTGSAAGSTLRTTLQRTGDATRAFDSVHTYDDIGQGTTDSSRANSTVVANQQAGQMRDTSSWRVDPAKNIRTLKSDIVHGHEVFKSGVAVTVGAAYSETTTLVAEGGIDGVGTGGGLPANNYETVITNRTTTPSVMGYADRSGTTTIRNDTYLDNIFTANVTIASHAATYSEFTVDPASNFSTTSDTMTGSGTGTMLAHGEALPANNIQTATADSTSHEENEAHRAMQAAALATTLTTRLHQRFEHLQTLWEAACAMIRWLEEARQTLPAYALAQMTIAYPDGLNYGAERSVIAARLMLQRPLGLL